MENKIDTIQMERTNQPLKAPLEAYLQWRGKIVSKEKITKCK